VDATDRVSVVLACCALDPGLAAVLFLDLDPAVIYPLARWLAGLLGDEPPVFSLGPKLTEEALWERIVADPQASDSEGVGFKWAPGPLAGYSRRPGIVVVPDLLPLSLPAARAAVTLAGAEVAHLERSGMSRTWRPRDRWLAAMHRQDAGRVSPHLLDRFSLRVDAANLALPRSGRSVLPAPDPAWVQAVEATRSQTRRLPQLSGAAAERVVALNPPGATGARRDLAVGRLARALAGLAGEPEVSARSIETAAELIGLGTDARRPGPALAHASAAVGAESAGTEGGPDSVTAGRVVAGPTWPDGVDIRVPVTTGGEPERLLAEPLSPESVDDAALPPDDAKPDGPYPEDEAVPQRDADPLRVGRRPAVTGPPRGHPIGTRRALDVNDIAIVATLLEAARHQKTRSRDRDRHGHSLHVRAADLRSYRRAPRPASLLVLVLDHTCRSDDWDWYEALAPYLRWAYVTRAPVGVVEVGAADPGDGELRATRFRCRSLLDPRLPAALERPPGRATPLAHGLTLAAARLRHDTQQGGAPVGEATLVVVTDGRANVPLAASQLDALPGFVGESGVLDALDTARAIRTLHRVRSVVIDPGPQLQGHLAAMLAEALGAPLVHGIAVDAIAVPVASGRARGAA
jgi:magnesium chelatase subunit D